MPEMHINALITEIGVNCGDHAQDITRAVVITPDMTFREACEKFLTKTSWCFGTPDDGFKAETTQVPDCDKYLTVRLATEDINA